MNRSVSNEVQAYWVQNFNSSDLGGEKTHFLKQAGSISSHIFGRLGG